MRSMCTGRQDRGRLALVYFVLVAANVGAFQAHLADSLARRTNPTATSLASSLSTPSSDTYFDDDDSVGSKETKTTIQVVPINNTPTSSGINGFHRYLKGMSRNIRTKPTLADRMNDELKRLEINFYNLTGDDVPQCQSDTTKNSYNGPVVRPDARCYTMVCSAYAHAGRGEEGAKLAEEVSIRYEKLNLEPANAFIMTSVMKAWVQADNWEQVDSCLQKIEDQFAATKNPLDSPDCMTYTCYIKGLAISQTVNKRKAATKSLEILDKMRDMYISGENKNALPNRHTYSYTMKCQERSAKGLAVIDRIEKVYRQLEADYDRFGVSTLKPTAIAAFPLFNAASRCMGSMAAAKRAEEFLDELQKRYDETGDPEYRPLEGMYTSVLTAYAKVDVKNAQRCAKKVDEVLEAMERNQIKPSLHAITAAMNAKVNYRSEANVQKAEELMRSMKFPDSVAYRCLIKAYSKIGNPEKADELLHELQNVSKKSFHKRGEDKSPSDVMTIGACIDAWSKMGNKDIDRAIERAEHHLQQIVNKYRDGLVGPHEKHVDSWVFETVIRLWAGSRKPESAERIMSLIDQMEELNKVVPGLFRPTTNAFVLALDAWAISGREDGGKKAMVVIRKMRKLHEEGKLDEPNIRALSSALASVTRASGRGVVSTAEDLYRQILELFKRGDRSAPVNSRTLTSLLTTLLYKSNESDAHVRALRVLRQTIDLGRDHLSLLAPNTIVFNCVLNGLAKRHVSDESWELFQEMKVLQSEGYDCSPDVVTYSCVGRAMASSRIPSSADKLADRLAQLQSEILQRYEEGSLKPDIQLFNTIIIGYSNLSKFEPTAAKKANDILAWLESLTEGDLTPDLLTYSSICHANAMSKTIGTTRIAEETLLRAESLAAEGRITALNSDIYSSVALAHTRSQEEGSLEKAEYFIDQMEVLRKEGHPKVKSKTQIFNTLLSAHASSRDPDKVAKAVSTFNNMNDIFLEGQKECEPDVHSFNWIILAAARTFDDSTLTIRENFDVALQQFKVLHSDETSANPNSSTYEYFLQACYRLLPEGDTRNKLVEKAFELCRQRSLITPQVCKRVFQACPLFPALEELEASRVDKDLVWIPESWCAKVPKPRIRKVKLQGSDYV